MCVLYRRMSKLNFIQNRSAMLLLLLRVLFCMHFQTSNAHSLCVTPYAHSFTMVLLLSSSRSRIMLKNLFTLVWLMNVCEAAILLCTHATHIHSPARKTFLCCNVPSDAAPEITTKKNTHTHSQAPTVCVRYKWIGRWQRSRICGFPWLWEDFLQKCM